MNNPMSLRKKLVSCFAVMALASMFGLVACTGETNHHEQEEAPTQQEQNAADASSVAGTDGQESADATPEEDPDSVGVKIEDDIDAEGYKLHLDDMKERVKDATSKADQTLIPEDPADRPAAYYEAVSPLEKLEAELDYIDGHLEESYNKGTISHNDFWQLHDTLEDLEDQLDQSIDSLQENLRPAK